MSDGGPASSDVRARYLDALLAGDRVRAFAIVDDASGDATGDALGMAAMYRDVFQPALREIGRLWQRNAISVADEHLATAITQAGMARVYQRHYAWRGEPRHSLVAACADIERHEVGLRMLCDLLDVEGWDTVYLGATVPADSLVAMVRKRQPDVVALSATLLPHVPRVAAMIREVRAAAGARRPLILLGGRVFLDDPALATRVGADLTAPDAVDAVRLLLDRFEAAA